jgi:putative transposase
MRRYIRNYAPGGIYFFTVVTYDRRPILTEGVNRSLLHAAVSEVRHQHPFTVIAIILLPDHLHTVWSLPPGDCDFSIRLKKVKELFTKRYLVAGGQEGQRTPSQKHRGQRGVWQPRFWEHTVRDEADLAHCVDYVHWNPVKHGLVAQVRDYPWSTFHRFVKEGFYSEDWGGTNPCPTVQMPE